ncbi:hypothetical protein FDK38_002125 [Candidozyma auris]|nr:hypothetical protein FDK38_002125 [[Candida] auris]
MFRQLTVLSRSAAVSRVTGPATVSRAFSVSIASRKSVVDTAKEVLDKANKKTGEFLASTLESSEKISPSGENIKKAAKTVNQKTGDVLADGLEKTEEIAHKAASKTSAATDKVKESVENTDIKVDARKAAEHIKGKAGEAAHKAKETAADVKDEVHEKAQDHVENAKEKASDLKGEVHAKARVHANTSGQGYEDLQKKGSKIEVEQNRPDDGV